MDLLNEEAKKSKVMDVFVSSYRSKIS